MAKLMPSNKYKLKWYRGTEIKTVQARVRLEVVIAKTSKGKRKEGFG